MTADNITRAPLRAMIKLVSYTCPQCETTHNKELDHEPFNCPSCGCLVQLLDGVNIDGFDFFFKNRQETRDECHAEDMTKSIASNG